MLCQATLRTGRPWASTQVVLLVGWMLGGWVSSVPAQSAPPRSFPIGVKDIAVRNVAEAPAITAPSEGDPARRETSAGSPPVEMMNVTIRTDAPAVPGAKLVLRIDREVVEGSQFRWSQVEGAPVEIDDPTKPAIQITIPRGTDQLGFLLVAARPDRIRVFRVMVPIRSSLTDSWGSRNSGKIKADAGHDQVGLVGHRVTLNGSRSVPGDGGSARWLKVSGPSIVDPQVQGPFFSFIQSAQGTYRFLLLVSGDGAISEPDEVNVLVGLPPSEAAGNPANAMAAPAVVHPPASTSALSPVPASTAQPGTFERTVAEMLPRLPDGARIGSEIGDVMKAIADRASIYTSFVELQSELTRRLDVVLPADPTQRSAWAQNVFQPLSAETTNELLAAGLDLRQPQGVQQPLSPAQQERIGEHFQRVARAFRADQAAR